MGELIILKDWKDKKKKAGDTTAEFKKVMKDSLDNNRVMAHYNIKQPTEQERLEKVRASINRINALMEELSSSTKVKT